MKTLLILTLSSICWLPVIAQPDEFRGHREEKPNKEKVEAMKISFLTRRMDLTTEEAQRFWPVYNQYAEELEKSRGKRKAGMDETRNDPEKLTDAEIEKRIDAEMTFRQEELDIQKKYHSRFKQVLPIRKVARFYRAEEEFKRELIERLRQGKENKPGPPTQRMRR